MQFVQRMTSEEIVKGSPIFECLKKLKLSRSRFQTIEKVTQRKYDAIEAIMNMSWEDLGL